MRKFSILVTVKKIAMCMKFSIILSSPKVSKKLFLWKKNKNNIIPSSEEITWITIQTRQEKNVVSLWLWVWFHSNSFYSYLRRGKVFLQTVDGENGKNFHCVFFQMEWEISSWIASNHLKKLWRKRKCCSSYYVDIDALASEGTSARFNYATV